MLIRSKQLKHNFQLKARTKLKQTHSLQHLIKMFMMMAFSQKKMVVSNLKLRQSIFSQRTLIYHYVILIVEIRNENHFKFNVDVEVRPLT